MVGAFLMHERTTGIHRLTRFEFGEAGTFPLIVLFTISDGGYIQMSFCLGTYKLGVSKLSNLGLAALWKAITSYADL